MRLGKKVVLPAGKRRSFGIRKYNILPQLPHNLLATNKITGNWKRATGSSQLLPKSGRPTKAYGFF